MRANLPTTSACSFYGNEGARPHPARTIAPLALALMALFLFACCTLFAQPADAAEGSGLVASAPGDSAYAILYEDGDLVLQRGGTEQTGKGAVLGKWANIENGSNDPSNAWYQSPAKWLDDGVRTKIKHVVVADPISPISTHCWFEKCTSLTSVSLSGLDMSQVTDMNKMFAGCTSLKTFDLSVLDTSEVTNMNGLFSDCKSLTSVNLAGVNTSKATSMSYLFAGCTSLATIDLAALNTSKVTDMSYLLKGCTSLKSASFVGLNTSKVTKMNHLLDGCSSLSSVNFTGIDTSQVVDMDYLLAGCKSLASVNLAGLDTAKVVGMASVFRDCSALKSIDLSPLDLSSVARVGGMFTGCTSLTKVKLDAKTKMIEYLPTNDNKGHLAKWVSAADGVAYTSQEILEDRMGIADTYTKLVIYPLSETKITLSKTSFTYTGKPIKPKVTVKHGGKTLVAGTDYTVAYRSNVSVGTKATVVISGKFGYKNTVHKTFAITKATNPMKLQGKTISFKVSTLKAKAQVKSYRAAIAVTNAKGKLTFKKKSGNAKVTIASNGNITVGKGLKKGSYRVTATVRAAGNANYKVATRNATFTIKVI